MDYYKIVNKKDKILYVTISINKTAINLFGNEDVFNNASFLELLKEKKFNEIKKIFIIKEISRNEFQCIININNFKNVAINMNLETLLKKFIKNVSDNDDENVFELVRIMNVPLEKESTENLDFSLKFDKTDNKNFYI